MTSTGCGSTASTELLDRLTADGRSPKFIYSVPTFQNPAGVTLSAERRRQLVAIARERELLVVEDNPYGLLRYEGEPTDPLYQLDGGDYVIYVGTLSKILSPGIRLGWMCAPPPVMEKVVLGKQAADLCTSTLTQYFVAEYFAEGRWRDYVERPDRRLSRRRDAMLEALERHFPASASWTRPEGGLFVWATLPEYIDTTDLLAKALREDVAFVPGAAAYVDGRGASSMRLNFSGFDRGRDPRGNPADRRRGRRAGRAVREHHRRAQACPAPPPGRPSRATWFRSSDPSREGRGASRAGGRSSARSRCEAAPGSRTRWRPRTTRSCRSMSTASSWAS